MQPSSYSADIVEMHVFYRESLENKHDLLMHNHNVFNNGTVLRSTTKFVVKEEGSPYVGISLVWYSKCWNKQFCQRNLGSHREHFKNEV